MPVMLKEDTTAKFKNLLLIPIYVVYMMAW